MAAGFLITALGLFHMTNLDLQIDFRTAMLWRIYQVCAFGFLFVPVNTIAYTDMPPGASNQVSALTNVMRNLGGSFGISAATTILARHQQVHQAYLVRNAFQYNPKLQRILTQLTDLFSGRTGPEHAMQQAQGRVYTILGHQASVLAYIDVCWMMGVLCLLAIGLLFFAEKAKPGRAAMAH